MWLLRALGYYALVLYTNIIIVYGVSAFLWTMIKNNSFKLSKITENIFTTSEMIISNRVGREFLIKKKQSVQLLVR